MLGAATPNGQGAIGVSASEIAAMLTAMQAGFTPFGGNTGTLTAAMIAGGFVLVSGGSTATLTTDTATNIINQLTQSQGASVRIGQTFLLDIANLNSGSVTLAGGTGVTVDTAGQTIATTVERQYLGIVTGTVALGGANAVRIANLWGNTGVTA